VTTGGLLPRCRGALNASGENVRPPISCLFAHLLAGKLPLDPAVKSRGSSIHNSTYRLDHMVPKSIFLVAKSPRRPRALLDSNTFARGRP
jgi:hypothetical protein